MYYLPVDMGYTNQGIFKEQNKAGEKEAPEKGDQWWGRESTKTLKTSGHNSRLSRYPVQQRSDTPEDPCSINTLVEMEKAWPRDHVLLPLLESIYDTRMMYVELDDQADVCSTLEVYPAMCRPAAVSLCWFKCVCV